MSRRYHQGFTAAGAWPVALTYIRCKSEKGTGVGLAYAASVALNLRGKFSNHGKYVCPTSAFIKTSAPSA
jgi:hypothetical protein